MKFYERKGPAKSPKACELTGSSWAKLHNDFIGGDTKGFQYNKEHEVHNTPEGSKYFKSNHLNHVKIRFYGDMAVAQGDEIWVRRSGQPLTGRFVWTDTWLLRNDKWQIIAAEDLIAPVK